MGRRNNSRGYARRNRGDFPSVDPKVNLSPEELQRGAQAFEDWHWGIGAHKVVDWDDNDMPPMLIECGRLIRLHVRAPRADRHPRRDRDAWIEFSREISSGSHIAYDPDHPHERLYLLVHPKAMKAIQQRFWRQNPALPMALNRLALMAGGRHARTDYPEVVVKPIGVLTAVVYATNKKGDGPSYYIHQMGELSHHFPILAVDQTGRLWIAGGNYTSPTPGITD